MADSNPEHCSASGCDGKLYKEGYCVQHYVELVQSKAPVSASDLPMAASDMPQAEPTLESVAEAEPAPAPAAEAPADAAAQPAAPDAAAPTEVAPDAKAAAEEVASIVVEKAPESAAPAAAEPEPVQKSQSPAPAPVEKTPSPAPNSSSPAPPPSNKPKSMFGGGGVPCQVCNKTCFPAEAVLYEMQTFHKNCFRCTKCNKKIEQNSQASKYEGKVYCRACFDREGFARKQTKVQWTPKTDAKAPSSVGPQLGGGGVPCTVCAKTVYAGEAVSYEQEIYHKQCLKCVECSVACTVNTCGKFDHKIYCKRCFQKNNFARKQAEVKNFQPKQEKTSTYRFQNLGGGGDKCVNCSKTVYPAETVSFEGQKYHNKCFVCANCKQELKAATAQNKGTTPYCKKCYFDLGLNKATLNPVKAEGAPSN